MKEESEIISLLKKYQPVRENLIPILLALQEKEGFLSEEILFQTARYLGLSTGKVYGVATFYNQFRFRKKGKWELRLCLGTACHVKGSGKLLEFLRNELGIQPGETTADGLFSLETAACLGVCGFAPVLSVNGTVHSSVTEEKIRNILKKIREGEKA